MVGGEGFSSAGLRCLLPGTELVKRVLLCWLVLCMFRSFGKAGSMRFYLVAVFVTGCFSSSTCVSCLAI